MAEDFISRPRTRPRTWDPRTRTRMQCFVLKTPQELGQVLENTSLIYTIRSRQTVLPKKWKNGKNVFRTVIK